MATRLLAAATLIACLPTFAAIDMADVEARFYDNIIN